MGNGCSAGWGIFREDSHWDAFDLHNKFTFVGISPTNRIFSIACLGLQEECISLDGRAVREVDVKKVEIIELIFDLILSQVSANWKWFVDVIPRMIWSRFRICNPLVIAGYLRDQYSSQPSNFESLPIPISFANDGLRSVLILLPKHQFLNCLFEE